MKAPASEIGVGLALILLVFNSVWGLMFGVEGSAPGWIILGAVLLMNIWVRLIQIAELLDDAREREKQSVVERMSAPRQHRGNPTPEPEG